MNSSPSLCKDSLGERLAEAGASKWGFAEIAPVALSAREVYRQWLADGKSAEMAYLGRYGDVRDNPALLLDGARSIIVAAFNYFVPFERSTGALRIARYALVDDYHEVVRQRLEQVAQWIRESCGADTRVCVDTAPLRERYWAQAAGLGFIGRNGLLIIPGAGSFYFLGEILTTAAIAPDSPYDGPGCGDCRRCVDACPGRALDGVGGMDARRCLSYLSIEHRGDFSPSTSLHGRFYGCDTCQDVCPYNALHADDRVGSVFAIRDEIASLRRGDIDCMTPAEYSRIFRHSPIKRAKLAGLKRNLSAL